MLWSSAFTGFSTNGLWNTTPFTSIASSFSSNSPKQDKENSTFCPSLVWQAGTIYFLPSFIILPYGSVCLTGTTSHSDIWCQQTDSTVSTTTPISELFVTEFQRSKLFCIDKALNLTPTPLLSGGTCFTFFKTQNDISREMWETLGRQTAVISTSYW